MNGSASGWTRKAQRRRRPSTTTAKHLAREVARKTLNLGLLKAVQVRLPGHAEQLEIVRRVELIFAAAAAVGERAEHAAEISKMLPQAVLSRALGAS